MSGTECDAASRKSTRNIETAIPSLDNPVFHTYMIAASIMMLKLMFQPWIRY